MTTWFDVDGSNGRAAIYTGDNDAPMANPIGNLSRVKFHSDFAYIPFVPARRIVANVTAVAAISDVARGPMRRTINLGAHGMPGVPFIYGFVTVGGVIRPMCGSIPVRTNSFGDVIHWTLGVNASNVFISEGRSYPSFVSGVTCRVEVFISDKVI